MSYVIIASNSNLQMWAYGTQKAGRVFSTWQGADVMKRKLEKKVPGIDFLVVDLRASDEILKHD